MLNVILVEGQIDNSEHCVSCGEVIPEGQQYCGICEKKHDV